MIEDFIAKQEPAIQKALNHGFVFLFFPDKIQHFPARNWSQEKIQVELEERFQSSLTFNQADNQMWTAQLANHPDVTIIIP